MVVSRLLRLQVIFLLLALYLIVIPASAVEKPIISSVVVENVTITDGGEVHIVVSGTADARITQGFYSRSNPMGYWGCGFQNIIQSETNWTGHIRYAVSPLAPSGEYKFSNIRVMDEIEQQSDYWPETITVTVINSQSLLKPVIRSVTVENETIINGGEVHIIVSGTADARVTQGFYSRSNPMGYWGCGFQNIIQSETNWTGHIRYAVSPLAPSGEYKFSNIRVMDEIEQQSDYWPDTITVTVSNSQSLLKPVIGSVTVENETIINGGEVHIIVSGTAGARITQGFYSRSNPMGYWGCGFQNIIQSETNWTGHIRYAVSPFAPSGEYKFSNIRVMDEIEQQSDYWPETITVYVDNDENGEVTPTPTTTAVTPTTTPTPPPGIDKPVIISASLNQEEFMDGGTVILNVTANSVSPVNWLSSQLDGPKGNIFGGGCEVYFTEISPYNWSYQRSYTISPYAPSGNYTWSGIQVENENQEASNYWPAMTFSVNNQFGDDIPVIISAELNQYELHDGGTVILNVTARSKAPVNWLSSRLDGPKGNIFGGGCGVHFTETSPDSWNYHKSYTISPYAPSGNYTWSGIQVENENQEASQIWVPLIFCVNNQYDNDIPVITSAELNKYEFYGGGIVTLKVVATSRSPVNWLSSRLDGPKGNIFGGGCGVHFTEISSNNWSYQSSYTISPYAPSGNYVWSGIQVENENQEASNYCSPLTFTVIYPTLLGNFTTNTTIGPDPLTVQFNDTSTGDPTTWFWTFGDGVTSTDQHPAHTYQMQGTYTVNLTVSSGSGSDTLSRPDYITVMRLKGDFNGNSVVDIGDVSRVAYMVVGKTVADPAADFNENGAVDIGDAAKIAYYFVGKIPAL